MNKPRHEDGRFVKTGRNKCSIESCSNLASSKGYCCTHVYRLKKFGDVNYVKPKLSKEEASKKRTEAKRKYKTTLKGKISKQKYTSGVGHFTKLKNTQNRRYNIKKATPPWVDFEKIKDFYNNTPENMSVDHIHPIVGYDEKRNHISSGLHVHWNLQYLPIIENCRKGNKII